MYKVLKFKADWCGPCKVMTGVLNQIKTDVVIEEIDIDSNPELTSQFNVRGIPTMIMVDNAREVKRLVGLANPDQVTEWLKHDSSPISTERDDV